MDNCRKLELIHDISRKAAFIRYTKTVNHNNLANRSKRFDKSFKFLTYHALMVVYWTTKAVTGNGELGFDSGEGA